MIIVTTSVHGHTFQIISDTKQSSSSIVRHCQPNPVYLLKVRNYPNEVEKSKYFCEIGCGI